MLKHLHFELRMVKSYAHSNYPQRFFKNQVCQALLALHLYWSLMLAFLLSFFGTRSRISIERYQSYHFGTTKPLKKALLLSLNLTLFPVDETSRLPTDRHPSMVPIFQDPGERVKA